METVMQQVKNNIGWAFAGAAAVMIILAVSLPLHLIFKTEFVPTHISNAIIERTPPDNAIALQNALGALAFPFALMGGIMITGMFGFVGGLVYNALRRFGDQEVPSVYLSGIVVGLIAFLLFPQHVSLGSAAPLLLTGYAIRSFRRPNRNAPSAKHLSPADPDGFTRRAFLRNVGIFSVGGLILSVIDGFPVFLAALNASKPGTQLFAWTAPAARKQEFPAPGVPPEVTPVEAFYEMRKFPTVVPPAAPDFKLVIDGLVNTPLQLSMSDLLALPRTDTYITRQCVSNPVGGSLISTALFSGVPLRDVIDKAGLQPGVVQLKFYGRDGYEESVPVEYALQNGLIAYAMNGATLPDNHGTPLKMEIPGLYGFKNMKWLTRIEAINKPFQGVWAREGWTQDAFYKTMSKIDAVTLNPKGGTTIAGIAFTTLSKKGIQAVQVQVNGGTWQDATLHTPPLSERTWVQWRLDVPDRGALTIGCRAVAGDGEAQIEAKQQQFPDGASGLHTVTINV
jgi:DMSO/TMAO reductase YedYZ molybdopterin-dependent catalytic subunit